MYTLLDKNTLFPDLIQSIQNAKKFVIIDAYIRSDDETGNEVAQACLEAADRGIQIIIRKDISGIAFEHTPRSTPFFPHKHFQDPRPFFQRPFFCLENYHILTFFIFHKRLRYGFKESNLAKKLQKHPNITIEYLFFFNHGKLILIDDTAYIGGQCISNDYKIRQDYNYKIQDPKVLQQIHQIIKYERNNLQSTNDTHFFDNDFHHPHKLGIHQFLKDFIANSQEELIIQMAYYSLNYVEDIEKIANKGIKVKIIIGSKTDANHHTNIYFAHKLLNKNNPNIEIYLYEEVMIHTKGMATPHQITIGSSNFHSIIGYAKALNEHNIFSTKPELVDKVFSQFQNDLKKCRKIEKKYQLPRRYRINSLVERIGVSGLNCGIYLFQKNIDKNRQKQAKILKEKLGI